MFIKSRVSIFCLIISIFSFGGLDAQELRNSHLHLESIGINKSILNALKLNPLAIQAMNNVEIAESRFKQTRSFMLPQLSLKHEAERFDRPYVHDGSWENETYVEIEQKLFDLQLFKKIRKSKDEIYQSEARRDNVHQKIGLEISESFLDVLRSRLNLGVVNEYFYYLERLEKELLSVSSVSEEKKNLIGAKKAQAFSDRLDLIREIREAESEFLSAARFNAKDFFLIEPCHLEVPETLKEAMSIAEEMNPDVRLVQSRIKASQKNLESKKAQRIPSLSLKGKTKGSDSQNNSYNRYYSGGSEVKVEFKLPLATGGRIKEQEKEARLNMQNDKLGLEAELIKLNENLSDTFYSFFDRDAQIEGICNGLKAQKSYIDTLEKRATKMDERDIRDFLSEREKMIDLAQDLNQQLMDKVFDSYKLHSQMGTLLDQIQNIESSPGQSFETHTPSDIYGRLMEKCQ